MLYADQRDTHCACNRQKVSPLSKNQGEILQHAHVPHWRVPTCSNATNHSMLFEIAQQQSAKVQHTVVYAAWPRTGTVDPVLTILCAVYAACVRLCEENMAGADKGCICNSSLPYMAMWRAYCLHVRKQEMLCYYRQLRNCTPSSQHTRGNKRDCTNRTINHKYH